MQERVNRRRETSRCVARTADLSRALGVLLRDVVFTADEIRGLTAGLLASHQPALGRISFLEWLQENASTLGRAYANELDRHFRARRSSAHAHPPELDGSGRT